MGMIRWNPLVPILKEADRLDWQMKCAIILKEFQRFDTGTKPGT